MRKREIPKIDYVHTYEHTKTAQMSLCYLNVPDKNLIR